VTANTQLSSKKLSLEKQLLEEQRKRVDLEKKLLMGPGPQASVGKENGIQNVNTIDDLKRV